VLPIGLLTQSGEGGFRNTAQGLGCALDHPVIVAAGTVDAVFQQVPYNFGGLPPLPKATVAPRSAVCSIARKCVSSDVIEVSFRRPAAAVWLLCLLNLEGAIILPARIVDLGRVVFVTDGAKIPVNFHASESSPEINCVLMVHPAPSGCAL
jgi:hypothetical protein